MELTLLTASSRTFLGKTGILGFYKVSFYVVRKNTMTEQLETIALIYAKVTAILPTIASALSANINPVQGKRQIES